MCLYYPFNNNRRYAVNISSTELIFISAHLTMMNYKAIGINDDH